MSLPQILYVDDEEMNLLLFSLNFKKHFEVLTAKDPQEAYQKVAGGLKPDVVVSDMKMPGQNGVEFLQSIRGHLQEAPFYILTGFEINEEIQQALNSGLIRNYLRKPFNRNSLLEEFQRVLGQN